MKRVAILMMAVLLVAVLAAPGQAAYPEKAITYQIPFGPGGQSDLEARRQQPLCVFFRRQAFQGFSKGIRRGSTHRRAAGKAEPRIRRQICAAFSTKAHQFGATFQTESGLFRILLAAFRTSHDCPHMMQVTEEGTVE